MWDSPSRASFGKVGSIMKRFRVPIDRHADGQLTEVSRKIVLVVPSAAHASKDRQPRRRSVRSLRCCGRSAPLGRTACLSAARRGEIGTRHLVG